LKRPLLENVKDKADVTHPVIRYEMQMIGFKKPQVEITTLDGIPQTLAWVHWVASPRPYPPQAPPIPSRSDIGMHIVFVPEENLLLFLLASDAMPLAFSKTGRSNPIKTQPFAEQPVSRQPLDC
jgi:hypothetical protein